MTELEREIGRRRTFAIISHPDAGKTTLTEKFLLYGGAIQTAGSVKGKATAKHAVSDWMELEKQRGISIIRTHIRPIPIPTRLNISFPPKVRHLPYMSSTGHTIIRKTSLYASITGDVSELNTWMRHSASART